MRPGVVFPRQQSRVLVEGLLAERLGQFLAQVFYQILHHLAEPVALARSEGDRPGGIRTFEIMDVDPIAGSRSGRGAPSPPPPPGLGFPHSGKPRTEKI